MVMTIKKLGLLPKVHGVVKWHFLTMGKKKNETFTVVGIGDMSGDVLEMACCYQIASS